MYYQIIFTIEKHYLYIHEIEENLTEVFKPFEICREGKNYLNHYPLLSFVVDKIYTIVFPSAIILFAICKWMIVKEKDVGESLSNWNFLIDTVVLFSIILISLLYLIHRHFNDFKRKVK
jgi:hypothetical protein